MLHGRPARLGRFRSSWASCLEGQGLRTLQGLWGFWGLSLGGRGGGCFFELPGVGILRKVDMGLRVLRSEQLLRKIPQQDRGLLRVCPWLWKFVASCQVPESRLRRETNKSVRMLNMHTKVFHVCRAGQVEPEMPGWRKEGVHGSWTARY